MAKIMTMKQFKEGINAAFETQKTRDEAKGDRSAPDQLGLRPPGRACCVAKRAGFATRRV